MVWWLTGTDEVVDQAQNDQQSRKLSSGLQELINRLRVTDHVAQ